MAITERFIKDFMVTGAPQAKSYQKLTVNGTAASFTLPDGCNSAVIAIESSATGFAVRFLETGVDPTTTDGMPRSNGDYVEILGRTNCENFRIIQAQAGTHVAHITYYIQ